MIRIILLVYLLSIFSANSKQLIPSELSQNNLLNKSLSNTIDSITKDQKNLINHRLELLNKKTPFDLIYNHKTVFLKEAEKRGNLTIDGKGMFLGQAKHAFNIWTNILPKIDDNTKKLISDD